MLRAVQALVMSGVAATQALSRAVAVPSQAQRRHVRPKGALHTKQLLVELLEHLVMAVDIVDDAP